MTLLPKLDIYPFTDKGRREYQEDFLYTDPVRQGRPWLGIVSDGMGGHQGGDVASKAGVHALRIGFEAALAGRVRTEDALVKAVTEGHEAVLQAAANANAVDNMGATVVAFVIDGENLHWCTAGDSRLYLFRNGKVKQLSRDFTVGEDMKQGVEKGEWTQEEIDRNPQRNALTSFMGTDNWRFDARSTTLRAGDIVIACSDGVYGTIDTDGIASACLTDGSSPTAQQIAESMMKRILDVAKSNQDNSTAIVVRYEGAKSASSNGFKPVELANPPVSKKSLRTSMPWVAGGLVAVAGLAFLGYTYLTKVSIPGTRTPVAPPPSDIHVTPENQEIKAEEKTWTERVSKLESDFRGGNFKAASIPGAIDLLWNQRPKVGTDVQGQVKQRLVTLRNEAREAELSAAKNIATPVSKAKDVLKKQPAIKHLESLIERWKQDKLFELPEDEVGQQQLKRAQELLDGLKPPITQNSVTQPDKKKANVAAAQPPALKASETAAPPPAPKPSEAATLPPALKASETAAPLPSPKPSDAAAPPPKS